MASRKNSGDLAALQDYYLDRVVCSNTQALGVGDNLRVWNRHLIEVNIKDRLANRDSVGTTLILKDLHIARFIELRLIGQWVQGEFSPVTSDKEFWLQIASIWPEFIESWYMGVIYIGYGQDLVDQELEYIEKEGRYVPDHKLKPWCKFRLYRRIEQKKNEAGNCYYTSILSGLTGIEVDPKRLVVASCNDGLNWLLWYDLVGDLITGRNRFINAYEATSKRVVALVNNPYAFEEEMDQLRNPEPYLAKRTAQTLGINNNIYKPFEFMPVEHPLTMLKTLYAYVDIMAERMGYTGKGMNNKTERLTAAENYQGLKMVSNIQERHLMNLKVVCARMKEVFKGEIPDDFEVILSMGTTAQGLPESMAMGDKSHTALTPSPEQDMSPKLEVIGGNKK